MQKKLNEDKSNEILERLARIEEKIDDYKDIRDKAENAYSTSQQNSKDITVINNNVTWCWRTIVAAIITAIIGLIIKFK